MFAKAIVVSFHALFPKSVLLEMIFLAKGGLFQEQLDSKGYLWSRWLVVQTLDISRDISGVLFVQNPFPLELFSCRQLFLLGLPISQSRELYLPCLGLYFPSFPPSCSTKSLHHSSPQTLIRRTCCSNLDSAKDFHCSLYYIAVCEGIHVFLLLFKRTVLLLWRLFSWHRHQDFVVTTVVCSPRHFFKTPITSETTSGYYYYFSESYAVVTQTC